MQHGFYIGFRRNIHVYDDNGCFLSRLTESTVVAITEIIYAATNRRQSTAR